MRPAMSETLARSSVNFWRSAARSPVVAMVNSTVTSERPADETDFTSFSPCSCCTASSIVSVTSSATSAALAPGYWVMTCAWRMMNSGSSKRGSLS